MSITLKDIAEEVRLSVTTVSVVLRGDKTTHIAAETKQRIRDAAERLGYRHNIYARVLSTGKSRLIGLLTDSLLVEVGLSKLRAVDTIIRSKDYTTVMRNSEGVLKDEAQILDEFAGRMTEGVIAIQGLQASSYGSALSLMKRGIPVVSIEPVVGLDIDCITIDRKHGAYIAAKHLIETGHERIAILHGDLDYYTSQGKFQGYKDALEEKGIPIYEKLVIPFGATGDPRDGYDSMKALLLRKAGLTAVFCNNDQLAFGAMRAILEAGLRIPEDIAVVGFDNIALSAYAPVPLTTVVQPVDEIARLATELLFERIEGTNTTIPNQMIAVKPTLVVRQSSAIK